MPRIATAPGLAATRPRRRSLGSHRGSICWSAWKNQNTPSIGGAALPVETAAPRHAPERREAKYRCFSGSLPLCSTTHRRVRGNIYNPSLQTPLYWECRMTDKYVYHFTGPFGPGGEIAVSPQAATLEAI